LVWQEKPARNEDALCRCGSDHRHVGDPNVHLEIFRYRDVAKDCGTLEYVFESDDQNDPKSVIKEQVAEIAADFMLSFYGIQVGTLEIREFREQPIPFRLVRFSDTIKGPLKQMYFVVVLPNGTVVEPS
jgi:hypothetical protein